LEVSLKRNDNLKTYVIDSDWSVGTPIFNAVVDLKTKLCIQYISKSPLTYTLQYLGTQFQVKIETPTQHQYGAWMRADIIVENTNTLRSPMPGSVISINVKPGDKVIVGQEIAVVEAMKMQNVLRAERDQIVKEVLVKPGSQVSVDEILVVYETPAAKK